MALTVGDFTAKIGDGGSLKLQVEGKKTTVTNFANTFKGKVAAFFRGIFKPGTVATENRNVLNAFVSSIRSDPAFGDSFANIASTTLARDIQGGKPLTTRKVQNVMDQLQAAKRQNIGFTRFQAMVVAENQDTRPGTFGSLFANMASDKGLPVLTSNYDTRDLSRTIMREVTTLGEGGVGIVTARQAQDIAKVNIGNFLDKVQANINVVRQNMEQGPERTAMEKAALTASSPVKPKTITCAKELLAPATSVINAMCDPKVSTNDRLAIVKMFLEDVQVSLGKHYDEVGSDDLNAVLMLSLGYAGGLSGKGRQDFEGAFEACKGFKDTAEGLAVPLTGRYVRDQAGMDDVRKAGNGLTVLSRLSEFLAEQCGYSADIGSNILVENDLNHPNQISEAGRSGMEALGVPIPVA